jgi:hypothetical protein
MQHKMTKWMAICFIILILVSCKLPFNLTLGGSNTSTQDAISMELLIQTSMAQTSALDPMDTAKTIVAGTQTAVALSIPPVIPTVQLIPTETSTPKPPTVTPSPQGVFLTFSQNSYCRTDPSTASTRITTVMTGVNAKVVGRTTDYGWYYIDNPNAPGNYCWVWAAAGTVTGDLSTLKVITP